MHPDQLLELVRRHSISSRENLQVADRMRSLLPQVLRTLQRGHPGRGGVTERLALTDPAYLQRIDEYLDVYSDGLRSRVQSETHRMLLQAWQSLNAWRRVSEQKQRERSKPGSPAILPTR